MKVLTMKRKLLSFILIMPLILSLNGCVYLFVGGVGALGGYVISPDTVEGITENDKMSVWDATVEVVSIMGVIIESEEESGLMIARINGAKVTISVTELADSATRLTVKSRKSFFPRISISQNVFVKVMSQLNE